MPETPRSGDSLRANPRTRFSDRVDDYVRFRPRYPVALAEVIATRSGLRPNHTVADVGSGTGLSAEPFLKAGCRVIGIEPNSEMRQAAENLLASYPRFESLDGSAEETGLASASVDLVLAAQAFHWFEIPAAGREFARILRPPAWVALVWNRRRLDGTPFLRAYESLLLRYGTDYRQVRHENVSEHRLASFFVGDFERHALPNEQWLDRKGLIGRVRSSSYTPPPGHADHRPMMQALDALFEEHAENGHVRIDYDLEIYLGLCS